MRQQITNANLAAVVARINKWTRSPAEPYTDGRCNVGNYHIDSAYGGVKLVRMDNESGGIRDVLSTGYVSKRALYDAMYAFIAGIDTVSAMPSIVQARTLLETISRMETDTEFDERTDGDGMSGDDAVETLSRIIEQARAVLKVTP